MIGHTNSVPAQVAKLTGADGDTYTMSAMLGGTLYEIEFTPDSDSENTDTALLSIAQGGTGATTAAAARTALGITPANIGAAEVAYSTTDLTAGESALATGKIYLVYE